MAEDLAEFLEETFASLRAQQPSGEPSRIFAVVDASRDPMMIPPTIGALSNHYSCLYKGQALVEFGDDTAWIVEIREDEDVLDWLASEGFGKRWAIFALSSLDLEGFVRHLRKFTLIEDEGGTEHFFRFYDPQTIRQYLPVFTSEQLSVFFKGIDRLVLENTLNPEELCMFHVHEGELCREVIDLPSFDEGTAVSMQEAS
ncbi:DUF4123 domain-containing protein [Pseudovibrio ascidiaceicola]|uniref:DUF4123 domain-containing protein n=1 Tax=Pseudovibrio TaxID=258255 RepID=UPI0007AE5E92|nr:MULTISPECIES: DUF4123 domain-containing protein [unclassified Pseudovibrio]KZK95311.1 hypothetical protein PsW74_04095 [Pseudovibrio sp. W74]KZL07293.1 hypothetical protein PsAD14_03676 [Pseudovibrio sp. Ad14]